MTGSDFFSAIEQDKSFFGIDVAEIDGIKCAVIGIHDAPKEYSPVRVPFDLIAENDWDNIRNAILGVEPIHCITRIIGYFSRTSSWNPSKIAELEHRREAAQHYADFGGIDDMGKVHGIKEKEQ